MTARTADPTAAMRAIADERIAWALRVLCESWVLDANGIRGFDLTIKALEDRLTAPAFPAQPAPCCTSSHIPRDTACRSFKAGMNGRCVYCDHEEKPCHPGPGATCEIGSGESGQPGDGGQAQGERCEGFVCASPFRCEYSLACTARCICRCGQRRDAPCHAAQPAPAAQWMVGVDMASGPDRSVVSVVRAPAAGGEAQQCPDGGTCHHACEAGCFRVSTSGPLSGVYANNEWPAEIVAANELKMRDHAEAQAKAFAAAEAPVDPLSPAAFVDRTTPDGRQVRWLRWSPVVGICFECSHDEAPDYEPGSWFDHPVGSAYIRPDLRDEKRASGTLWVDPGADPRTQAAPPEQAQTYGGTGLCSHGIAAGYRNRCALCASDAFTASDAAAPPSPPSMGGLSPRAKPHCIATRYAITRTACPHGFTAGCPHSTTIEEEAKHIAMAAALSVSKAEADKARAVATAEVHAKVNKTAHGRCVFCGVHPATVAERAKLREEIDELTEALAALDAKHTEEVDTRIEARAMYRSHRDRADRAEAAVASANEALAASAAALAKAEGELREANRTIKSAWQRADRLRGEEWGDEESGDRNESHSLLHSLKMLSGESQRAQAFRDMTDGNVNELVQRQRETLDAVQITLVSERKSHAAALARMKAEHEAAIYALKGEMGHERTRHYTAEKALEGKVERLEAALTEPKRFALKMAAARALGYLSEDSHAHETVKMLREALEGVGLNLGPGTQPLPPKPRPA